MEQGAEWLKRCTIPNFGGSRGGATLKQHGKYHMGGTLDCVPVLLFLNTKKNEKGIRLFCFSQNVV
jgi:hypothetical protein